MEKYLVTAAAIMIIIGFWIIIAAVVRTSLK